jgi:hypothetical protein
MDLASNATAIFLVLIGLCIVLQLVTLALVAKIGSALSGIAQQLKQNRSRQPEKQGRDRRDQRRPKKPSQPSNAPSASPQNNQTAQKNSVDRSLREINLRLKSAERDQEKARQKLQDTNPNKKSRRGGSRRRRNRPRNNNQGQESSKDLPNRQNPTDATEHKSGGEQQRQAPERPRNERPHNEPPRNDKPVNERPNQPSRNEKPVNERPRDTTPREEEKPVAAPAPEQPAEAKHDTNETSFEHGRKFSVKRRALSAGSDSNEEQASESVESHETVEREISFGRR